MGFLRGRCVGLLENVGFAAFVYVLIDQFLLYRLIAERTGDHGGEVGMKR